MQPQGPPETAGVGRRISMRRRLPSCLNGGAAADRHAQLAEIERGKARIVDQRIKQGVDAGRRGDVSIAHGADEAVQIMGSLGYSRESLVEYCMRRTRGWMIAGGSIEMLKNRIAEHVFERRFYQRKRQAAE